MKMPNLAYILQSSPSNRKILVIVFIITAILMIDIAITTVIDFLKPGIASPAGIALFASMGATFAIGQFLLLSFTNQKIARSRIAYARPLSMAVNGIQYVLVAIFVIAVLQMALTSQYSSFLLTAVTTISFVLFLALSGVLSYKFFSWYRPSRNYVILLYGLAAAAATVNGVFALVFYDAILLDKPPAISSESLPMVAFDPDSWAGTVNQAFRYSAIASFVLLWLSSVLLIRQYYSQRFGRKRYWALISAPLAYFLIYFITEPVMMLASSDPSVMFYYFILFSFMNVAGGVIFGAAFLRVAKSVRQGSAVKDYMTIAGLGLVLLFVSGSAAVVHNPYPPFGLAALSFTGLSSYMVLLGLYSSAVSVSEDIKLRQSIRKSAYEESKLLDRIGSAQMEQELQKRISVMVKDASEKMKEQSGIEPAITDDDVKQYLEQAIKETRAAAKKEYRAGSTSDAA